MRTLRARFTTALLLVSSGAILGAGGVAAQTSTMPLPLSAIPVPKPSTIRDYIPNEDADRWAIALGKALFWDMQVGSDGVQACGTCHFRAGADPRKKNQISPGLLRVVFGPDEDQNPSAIPTPDHAFDGQGPNYTLRREDFPLKKFANAMNRASEVLRDTNNVVSSQGVFHEVFGQNGRQDQDPDGFYVGQGLRRGNVRRVEPRNTPTMINAVFNHRNFWDMRAQHLFNGVNPFGDRDVNAFVYRADDPQNPTQVSILLDNSSLASQAVGPPTNPTEMSADGRTFFDVGRSLMRELGRRHRFTAQRLLGARPLAKQLVHPQDSVLGPLSRSPLRGLNLTYEELIRRAFHRRWWDSPRLIQVPQEGGPTVVSQRDGNPATDEYTLMVYNFALFFGLAVQAYEATLVSDQTPFDAFLGDPVNKPLSAAAERGRRIFFNMDTAGPSGGCRFCHSGSLLSEASVDSIVASGMVRTSAGQLSDRGTRNIGTRVSTEDLGNGNLDPFGNSLSVAALTAPDGAVVAADGAFKIPGLRNVELTAPYFHTGGERTLLDVVNFYVRGGNEQTLVTRDPTVTIAPLNPLATIINAPDPEAVKRDLVEFLKALTDERVRMSAAPFDHPQIFVPSGHPGDTTSVIQLAGQAIDTFLEVPATGKNGGPGPPGFLE
jgi:cytochrome c peroxidase